MNREKRIRLLPVLLATMLLLAANACEKKKVPTEEIPLPADRVSRSPVETSQTVLHKTFTVTTSDSFPFEIPAHAAIPHLRGNYKSFVKRIEAQSNDDTANVEFLILTEEQNIDFANGHFGEALFSADASHDQDVNVSLPASRDLPKKYYLIFRNPPGGEKRKIIQADFTLDF